MNFSQAGFLGFVMKNKYRIPRHLLFWFFFYSDFILSFVGLTPARETYIDTLVMLALEVFVVYFNLYFLIPRFFSKGKLLSYLLMTLASMSLLIAFDLTYYFDFEEVNSVSDGLSSFFLRSQIVGTAIAIKIFKFYYKSNTNLEQVQIEKLKTELGFLKNQVNPHFLFNVMNSFYIQAKKKDDKLPEAIMSLSDLLRYQIYDTEKEYVSVESELDYIKNYLDLEKNRRDQLSIKIKSDNISKTNKIAPLLLLPLVENATKYSQRTDGSESLIEVDMNVKEDFIYFKIKNSKGKISEIKSPDSGIGLDNLQKRLKLIYPDDHEYTIEEDDSSYTTKLKLGVR